VINVDVFAIALDNGSLQFIIEINGGDGNVAQRAPANFDRRRGAVHGVHNIPRNVYSRKPGPWSPD